MDSSTSGQKRSMSLQLPGALASALLSSKAAIKAGRRNTLFPGTGGQSPTGSSIEGRRSSLHPKLLNKLRKGGKRDGTPEKPTTPNTDNPDEDEMGAKKQIIVNDEILAMQIKHEDLQKLREPRPPSDHRKKTPQQCSVNVRKLRPASEWDKPKPQIVTVAKPAPPDAPLKPIDYASAAGPRFDDRGNIIPHSILGSVEDYKKLALENGDLPRELATPQPGDKQPESLTLKYEKKPRTKPDYPRFESSEESKALQNWNARMLERKRQQGYLSKLLNKPADQLVMNQADSYRKTQELRYIIDRTIPTMDYGKGYRIGSEFWKQQERIGDDMTGIHMTMTQTEKGYPTPYEHVGVPKVVLGEKGTDWDKPRTPFHKPWHKSPYLQERRKQLQPVMDELDPYKPDILNLQIVGNKTCAGDSQGKQQQQAEDTQYAQGDVMSETGMAETEELKAEFLEREDDENLDPLRDHPDVHPAPVFGPSLQFAGQAARWTGDSFSFQGQVGIEARVSFETFAAHRTTSFLEIINDGTTAIYYDWKPVAKTNPFDVVNAKVQRFYFNTSSGVILPGDTMKFPFVFKSPNAGVFTEQWQFQTKPVVCGGAALVVTLRGVAIQQDKFKKQRNELERSLALKQAQQVVSSILLELVEGIRSPERPSSPIDAYITEAELFSRKNPLLNYNHELVQKLKALHLELEEKDLAAAAAEKELLSPAADVEEKELQPESSPAAEATPTGEEPGQEGEELDRATTGMGEMDEIKPEPWDLSVVNLRERIMGLEEDEDMKQDLLNRLNQTVFTLSFPTFTPTQQNMYTAGYQLMCESMDTLVTEALQLRVALGMPEKDTDDIPDEPNNSRRPVSAGDESIAGSISSTETLEERSGRRSSVAVSRRASVATKSQSSIVTEASSAPSSAKSERGNSQPPMAQTGRSTARTDLGRPSGSRDSKKGASKTGKAPDKKSGKDSKTPAKGGTAAAAAATAAAAAKEVSRGGKSTPGGSKRPTTREKDPMTPVSGQQSPTQPGSDPILDAKYREKLYTQAYVVVGELIDKMENVFCEIRQQGGGPPLPRPT